MKNCQKKQTETRSASLSFEDRTFYSKLGRNIANLRKHSNVSRGDLAMALGVSRSSVAMTETGSQRIYVDRLAKIATALNVPLNAFLPTGDLSVDELYEQLAEAHARIAKLENTIANVQQALTESLQNGREKDLVRV